MSAGTFTDEDGQVYVVDADGKLIPTGPKKPDSLLDQAKDRAKKEAGKQVENVVTRAAKGIPNALGFGGGGEAAASGTFSPATQATWNAGAMGGETLPEVAPATGMFDIAGIGSAGNAILPAAGLAGAYDLWANNAKSVGTGRGYLQGAASGAAIGSYFGPVGAGVGGGLGLLANAFGIGHESRTKEEEHRREQLAEAGVVVPNSGVKEWENNAKFAESRNEADLTGKDIIHSASLYGVKGYDKLDAAKQEAIANEALKQGLVREHHGMIDINMSDAYKKYLDEQIGAATVPTSTGGTRTSTRSSAPVQIRMQEDPREKKRRQIAQIVPELQSSSTKAPRYDINLSSLMTNPYL